MTNSVQHGVADWNEFFKRDQEENTTKVKFYDAHAHSYDDAMQTDSYNGTKFMAEIVHQKFKEKPDSALLFLPAGTGNEIAEVQKLGSGRYTNVTGLDAAEGMLKVLRNKNICQHFIHQLFHFNCGLPHDVYDGVVCVGGFVPKHLQVDALEEMCNVTKPGGLVMIMMREAYLYESEDYNQGKFLNEVQRLIDEKRWEKVCIERVDNYYGDLTGMKFIMRKL